VSRARQRLRELLAASACTPAAPIFDPLSARIAALLGWEVCKLSGSVAKAASLALPDAIPVANVADIIDISRRILGVADVSLIVDADDGGGSAVNVLRAVRELEAAGVAAIEIEDNIAPTRFAGEVGRHSLLVPKNVHVAKLKAAVAARQDPSTIIVARTSALNELPLDEALDRISAYSRTGAEALMLPAAPPGGRSDIEALRTVSDLPLCILGLPQDDVNDEDFLVRNKIRVRFLGQPTYRAAVKAIHHSLKYLKEGGSPAGLKNDEAPESLLQAVTRTPELMAWERTYDLE
jgi:carboxyvinyl-carboxyphosphonate phosphorylmutase